MIRENPRQEQEIINRKGKDMSTWGYPINLDTDSLECCMVRNYAETMFAELPLDLWSDVMSWQGEPLLFLSAGFLPLWLSLAIHPHLPLKFDNIIFTSISFLRCLMFSFSILKEPFLHRVNEIKLETSFFVNGSSRALH